MLIIGLFQVIHRITISIWHRFAIASNQSFLNTVSSQLVVLRREFGTKRLVDKLFRATDFCINSCPCWCPLGTEYDKGNVPCEALVADLWLTFFCHRSNVLFGIWAISQSLGPSCDFGSKTFRTSWYGGCSSHLAGTNVNSPEPCKYGSSGFGVRVHSVGVGFANIARDLSGAENSARATSNGEVPQSNEEVDFSKKSSFSGIWDSSSSRSKSTYQHLRGRDSSIRTSNLISRLVQVYPSVTLVDETETVFANFAQDGHVWTTFTALL
ncbi:hypothetical protein Hypma_012538 [Hypsizygus marmoreus]|uniref:Uncharacterized protein n=1 Tax=Hypsizygus marmoreus TaxID=39966 RepID=A0A369JGU1_HYPMA|nr:hypothetical protein Hypma_012538 [Hypsizygus marmoreus]